MFLIAQPFIRETQRVSQPQQHISQPQQHILQPQQHSHNLNNIKISCNLNNTSRKRMRDETTKTTPATRAAVLILLSKYTANKFLLTQHLLKRDKLCDLDRYFIIQQLTALKVKHLR